MAGQHERPAPQLPAGQLALPVGADWDWVGAGVVGTTVVGAAVGAAVVETTVVGAVVVAAGVGFKVVDGVGLGLPGHCEPLLQT